MEKLFKRFEFKLDTCEQKQINGQNIGIFKGLASTFEVDSDNDQIMPGTFKDAIRKLRKRAQKNIQMKFMHRRDVIIGGFPVNLAKEIDLGLFVEGHINLEVQKGNEVFSLIKQDVLTAMSMGFVVLKSTIIRNSKNTNLNTFSTDLRQITEIDIFENSIVDMASNSGAQITEKTLDGLESLRDVNDYLKELGLSNKESNILISKVKSCSSRDDDEFGNCFSQKLYSILFDLKSDKIINGVKND